MQSTTQITGSGQDVARGLNPTKPISSYDMVALLRLLYEKVQASVHNRSVSPLMEFVYSSLTAGADYVAHIPISCGKGCSYCCKLWVDATPPEVLYTVKTMPSAQREKAMEAVEKVCDVIAGVDFFDRLGRVNPPCSQVDEQGACSVYVGRPLNCRTTVSSDVEQCRATVLEGSEAGFPSPKVWMTLQDSYNTALEGALIRGGLAYQAHELNESLRIALNAADAEERWLAGADVFAGAAVSPATPIFQNPMWREVYRLAFGTLPV